MQIYGYCLWRWLRLYLVEVCEDAELGAHLRYAFLEFLNPLLLLGFLFSCHSPLTLNKKTDTD